jgi:EAL domain-containing protein (putative c-di-GMP-specific phosphodiesterase class I)
MISLAQSCGLRVLAEGVETIEHDALLKELGCDLLQGYLLARPMSAESLRGLLSTSSPGGSESRDLALI